MKNFTIIAAIAATLGAGAAYADHHGDHAAKLEAAFKAADKDGDGTLDKEEAKAMKHVAEHFDEIDGDKDGTVSLDEIHGYMKSHMHGKKK